MLDDDAEGKDPSKTFHWYQLREGRTKIEGGFLAVEENGEIAVCVEDDFYNGVLPVEKARALMLALQKVFANG